jgi:hypothetical protein
MEQAVARYSLQCDAGTATEVVREVRALRKGKNSAVLHAAVLVPAPALDNIEDILRENQRKKREAESKGLPPPPRPVDTRHAEGWKQILILLSMMKSFRDAGKTDGYLDERGELLRQIEERLADPFLLAGTKQIIREIDFRQARLKYSLSPAVGPVLAIIGARLLLASHH